MNILKGLGMEVNVYTSAVNVNLFRYLYIKKWWIVTGKDRHASIQMNTDIQIHIQAGIKMEVHINRHIIIQTDRQCK